MVAAPPAKIATAAAAAGSRRTCSLQVAFIVKLLSSPGCLHRRLFPRHGPARGVRGGCNVPIPHADASPEVGSPARPPKFDFLFARGGGRRYRWRPERDPEKWLPIFRTDRAPLKARVAELVDAHDSKSCSARSGGSIPSTGTNRYRAA